MRAWHQLPVGSGASLMIGGATVQMFRREDTLRRQWGETDRDRDRDRQREGGRGKEGEIER